MGPSLFCGPDINRLVLPTAEEEEEAIGPVADDVERQSHDFVLKQLMPERFELGSGYC